MILLNGDDEETAKSEDSFSGSTIRLPELAALRSVPSLPDYDTSERQHQQTLKTHQKKRKLFRFRINSFWRATLCALAIYIAVSVAVGIPFIVLNKPRAKKISSNQLNSVSNNLPPLPLNELLTKVSNATCDRPWNSSHQDPSSSFVLSQSTYTLPSSGILGIRSNLSTDSRTDGKLVVDVNPDPAYTDVLFQIQLWSSSIQLRDRIHICFMPDGSDRGLNIYVPKDIHPDDTLNFQINVLLPAIHSVNSLFTYLPNFEQRFQNLPRYPRLAEILIEGTNKPISSTYLGASQISVRNSRGPVLGLFSVTGGLLIDTVNATIDADVEMVQLGEETASSSPTSIAIANVDAPLFANLTLIGHASTSGLQHSFMTQFTNVNSDVRIDIAHAPTTPPAMLGVQVISTLAPTTIYLDSKFQGSFSLRSKSDSVTVNDDEVRHHSSSCPTGLSRNVTYHLPKLSTAISGWVGCGNSSSNSDSEGGVKVLSTLSPVTLHLDRD